MSAKSRIATVFALRFLPRPLLAEIVRIEQDRQRARHVGQHGSRRGGDLQRRNDAWNNLHDLDMRICDGIGGEFQFSEPAALVGQNQRARDCLVDGPSDRVDGVDDSMSYEMSDAEFLSYCATHSLSERCGFVPEHLARLCRLAGREDAAVYWDGIPNCVINADCDQIRALVAVARANTRECGI